MIYFNFSVGDDCGRCINYMYTCDKDPRFDDGEPYAQIVVPDELQDDPDVVEEYGYIPCKNEIIRQCAELGIPETELSFCWDDCEGNLSEYAHMGEGDVER